MCACAFLFVRGAGRYGQPQQLADGGPSFRHSRSRAADGALEPVQPFTAIVQDSPRGSPAASSAPTSATKTDNVTPR